MEMASVNDEDSAILLESHDPSLDDVIFRGTDESKLLEHDTLAKEYDKPPPEDALPPDNPLVEVSIPLLSTWEILALNLSFLGLNLMFLVLSVEVVPAQVLALVGSKSKATFLGSLVAFGAVITLITGPTVGMLSDRLVSQFGRRRPLMLIFSIVLTIGLLGMAFSAPHVDLQQPPPFLHNDTDVRNNGTNCDVDLEWRRCRPYYSNSSPHWSEFYERHKTKITQQQEQEARGIKTETTAGYLGLFILFYCVVIFGYVATLTPYHALIADRSHPDQRGICSGVMGGMVLFGNICGAAMGLLVSPIGVVSVYIISIVVMLLCIAITLCSIAELPSNSKPPPELSCVKAVQGYWIPFTHHNFRWVFITRFLMQMGLTSTVGFLEYWLHDMIPLPNCWSAIRGVSFMLLPLLVFAATSSVLCGIISDQFGLRKSLVMGASFVMAAVNLAMAGLQGNSAYFIAMGLAVVFGIAFGSYQAVDFALLMDVLPDPEEKSRDIAVWQQALNLPQALAVPIAGVIVDSFERVDCRIGLGYIIMFVVGSVYFLLSGILVTRIRL